MSKDGSWLRQARETLGYTQRQMAEKLRLSATTGNDHIRHMEKGRRPVSGPVKVAVEGMLAHIGGRDVQP